MTLGEKIYKLRKSEIKKEFGDVIYKIVQSAAPRKDYGYNEPSQLDAIKDLRRGESLSGECDKKSMTNTRFTAGLILSRTR